MRDGVRLSANVFLASEHARVPAILVRTPYGKGADITPNYQAFVEHGYAIVVQDVRGRYESEGAFQPLTQEVHDGDDTLNWIARQPWSDGKIGMMGGSYVGIVQWKAALANNPHLKAIFPVVSGYDDYRDRYYSTGGALKLGNRLEWMAENLRAPGYHQDFGQFVLHLPVRSADLAALGWTSPMYREVIEHPAFDAFWRAISTKEQLDKVRVPVFSRGRLVRQFRAERPGSLRGAAQAKRREPHSGGSVGAQHVDAVRGRELRRGFERAGARAADGVVRPVADGQGFAAAFQAPGEDLRDGLQRVARRAGVAAAGSPPAGLLPGERREGEFAGGRRRARATNRRASRRRTSSSSTRTTRCPRAAARCAAIRKSSRGGRWTSVRWSSARTCWCTPPNR